MKISVILLLGENEKNNQKTIDNLVDCKKSFSGEIEVLAYAPKKKGRKDYKLGERAQICFSDLSFDSDIQAYQDAISRATGDWITMLRSGDTWSLETLSNLVDSVKAYPEQQILMLKKQMPDGSIGAFAKDALAKEPTIMRLQKKYSCYPFYFGGTFLKLPYIRDRRFHPEYGLEAERAYFLDLCGDVKQVLFLPDSVYHSFKAQEGDHTFFADIYEVDWYTKSLEEFWLPYLEQWKQRRGEVPPLIQFHLVFTLRCRLLSNLNNLNKHVIPEGEEETCLKKMGQLLAYVDDNILFNCLKLSECSMTESFKWILGVLKYGDEYRFKKQYVNGMVHFGGGDTVLNRIFNLKTNILFMNYEDGYLHIDGTIHPILYSMADEVYLMFGSEKYKLPYNGRYTLTKVFGVSIYKGHSFHIALPMAEVKDVAIYCFANLGNETIRVGFCFESHFSRLSLAFSYSYWCFGDEKRYMAVNYNDGIRITETTKKTQKKQEILLEKEMLLSRSKRAWVFLAVRRAYFMMRPFMKRKPIWMYLDKIYKAGDSSEYLYRYASAQKDGTKHYYLVDKKSSDYKRLKADGFKPLVRGSIKHRLVFLMADMMVISNSTVFAFNNYGLPNSSYVRDLVNFHVCCVQHGMSVQKIAVAQNRLRDNTRLYFCASPYEIKNLSKPVYDYVGYDALKLTGVPRYDGLVNDDKKQIMISPTWRMQAAVPVRTNEGEQRDYNPLFKESSYFKVFNSLINDKRLIEAAKKYGYRIKYVLHPIVSAQVKDFDKNEYVDIIPAVGDMSYERMFCESSLMVTDFSGIQFDFAYMRKPLVYLHHKDIPQHYEEGTFFYDTMAFGEIAHDNDELIDLLCEYMENGCQMKDMYVKRADDFFYYNDHNNCKRIYDIMVDYQERKIFHRKTENERNHYTLLEKKTPDFNLEKRVEQVEEFQQLAKEYNAKKRMKSVADAYYDEPLKEKGVALVGLGKGVRGNMLYILNELNHDPKFEGYEVYVRTEEETESAVKAFMELNHWTRTKTVSQPEEYMKILESVKYLITEVYFPDAWIKRDGQVYINIWHGTPLKKLGLAKNTNAMHKDGLTQRNFIDADYLLYPNPYTKENMLTSYKVSDLMTGKVVNLGYPRTGGLLESSETDLSSLRSVLAPNGEKIFAYMPTWKDYLEEEQVIAEAKELLDYLEENMTENEVLYVNLHHKINASLDYSSYKKVRQFPSDVDSYQLLALTEALITDYSSVFYDYLVLRKQIILYCADYELYRERRGTYMDLMELPFDKVRTKEAVLEAMHRGKTYDDTKAFEEFCPYDSRWNAKKLCEIFAGSKEGLDLEEIPKSGKCQVLVYSESLKNGVDTKRLEEYTKLYDTTTQQVTIGCEMLQVDENKDSAYPMLSEVPVIGTIQEIHFSQMGKQALELYQRKCITFEKMMGLLHYDFALEGRRIFGRAPWDVVVIYDVVDPYRLLSLVLMPADNKLLFISEKLMTELMSRNEELIACVQYAANYVRGIFVPSQEHKEVVSRIIPEGYPVQVAMTAKDLNEAVETARKG